MLLHNAGKLICKSCNKVELLTTTCQVSKYLYEGWPKCCGFSMFWVNPDQTKKEDSCAGSKSPTDTSGRP
jgi:hypothetical protein